MTAISRRQLLRHAGFAGLAVLLPPEVLASCSSPRASPEVHTPAVRPYLVLTAHEAAVVEEATARLIPGPHDDPAEAGHPGAREAGVTRYIDTMLGALDLKPPKVFAGGPFSNRHGSPVDDMATFIGLDLPHATAWKSRLASFRRAYTTGVLALDLAAGGEFATAPIAVKDRVLAADTDGFMTMLFGHAIEGMYSVPEYGGNAGEVGWIDISFPGDVQPLGYDAREVSHSDGPDPYVPNGIGLQLLKLIGSNPK